ncbi:hypothetical protein [Actinacidiphila yeochonensis]|uniref:hypothetical protein n=1 Tax=Actinacidiphila yeochonensis TaxID=89050 RepID=UPI00056A46CF|nr:hypothetical protein [Actinacidiphila yeochonensis]
MTIHSAWLLTSGQTAQDTRLTQLGATLPADPLRVRSGILPGSADGSAVLAAFDLENRSGMSATVAPGRAVIQGMATQGAYPITLSDATPVSFADGDAQYDRIDLVCLRVYDASYADEQTTADLEVLAGKPDAVPQPPATPDLALPLYAVRVAAGTSAGTGGVDWTKVEDLRATTVATGGVLPAYGNTAVPGTYVGQLRDLGNSLQRWDGTAWVAYPQGIGGIAPADTATGAYTGQYRDTTDGGLLWWTGTSWEEPVPSYVFVEDAVGKVGTTASTTYVSALSGTATPVTSDFTAPASGAMVFRMGARVSTTSATATGYLCLVITQGSTTFQAAGDNVAILAPGLYPTSYATEFEISGMTPAQVYTATLYHRSSVSSATVTFRNRYLRIDSAS